ncbi:unnamed protein product [Phyllotreta striolata]|uniref:DRBM domain-containing protein n=1 Tax=Phyllotreta striolata TaxID=444603 RepID=A0A9N9TN12_PHYSR|nr:unnamed protein product [Phyllotreta striolata]
MSYNTRGGYAAAQRPQTPSIGGIGQRRPPNVANNFVSGGQLKSSGMSPQPQQPQQQQQQLNKPQQQLYQQCTGIQFRNQSQPQQQQPQVQQVQQKAVSTPSKQESLKMEMADMETPQQVSQQISQAIDVNDVTDGTGLIGAKQRKFFWQGNKISKKEKSRRRNLRLNKRLQPKNAVMILNELVKNVNYVIEELPVKVNDNQFKVTVSYEGVEHVGYGHSKIQAKNYAAEAALKHYVKANRLTDMKKAEEEEKMDVEQDEANQSPLPWQHIASFALYKLFCSWGEDPNIVKNPTQNSPVLNKPPENRPARKMPENPESINPLMLVNQMLPHAEFAEIGKTGAPPNIMFSFTCTVDGESFVGTGPNKKAAKKMAAFGACSKVLGVEYPKEVYAGVVV